MKRIYKNKKQNSFINGTPTYIGVSIILVFFLIFSILITVIM